MVFQINQALALHFLERQRHWQGAFDLDATQFGDLAMFCEDPEFFQNLVKLLIVGHGETFMRPILP